MNAHLLNHSGFPMMPPGFVGPQDRLIDNLGNVSILAADGRINIAALDTNPFPIPLEIYSANAINMVADALMILFAAQDINMQSVQDIHIDPHLGGAAGGLFLGNLKHGANQAAAGALAGEMWVNTTNNTYCEGV